MSGAAALIYEVAWAKMLALTFGSTTLSSAAVIAAFTGGMGLGAWLLPALRPGIERPGLVYARLELAIAIAAVVLTLGFDSLPGAFAELAQRVPSERWLAVVRFASVLVLLLPATILMGATYPALCAAAIRDARGLDRHLGAIYGWNTVGAAVGALLAGILLLERLGLYATTLLAIGMNVTVAGAALFLLVPRGPRDRSSAPIAEESGLGSDLPRWLVGLVLFLSGFTTLSYEIYWFRALRYLFGNATDAFAVVLAIFLVGLGFGSLALRRVLVRGSPERALGACQLAIGIASVAAILCHWLLLSRPEFRDSLSIFSPAVRSMPWGWRILIDAAAAGLMMLPATLLMGLSFPLASRLYVADVQRLGSGVGGSYLLANAGSVLGAIAGALLLLPSLKSFGATKLSAGLNLGLGLLVLAFIRPRPARVLRCAAALTAAAGAAAWLLPASPILRGEDLLAGEPGRLVHFEEGDFATVQVLEDPADPSRRAMAIDGCKIGYSEAFRGTYVHRKQVMLAHLPMVLDRRIRSTLNVGLGSGVTLRTLAAYPQVESLDCVEINAAVVHASAHFPSSAVLSDPRVKLVVEDAVHHMLRSSQRYDLIISDGKQDPWFSGNAILQCREFNRLVRDRLGEEGLFVQWIPLGVLNGDFRIILRTLAQDFPHVQVFYFPPWDVFSVASARPLGARPRMSSAEFASSLAHTDLAPHGIVSPAALLSHAVARGDQVLEALGPGPVSTWDHLRLDFSPFRAPRSAWLDARRDNLRLLLRSAESQGASAQLDDLDPVATGPAPRLMREAFAALYDGRFAEAQRLAALAVRADPEDLAVQGAHAALLEELPGNRAD